MPRYIAFLRGVSPANARMADLKHCFEQASLTHVRTILSSGNVAFDARPGTEASLQRRLESAMQDVLGRRFYTIVRPMDHLHALLKTDPYAGFDLPRGARRVVSFLREPAKPRVALPLEADGAQVLRAAGREVFTAYVPGEKGPVFMALIEKAFGKDITTRTWETLEKCAKA